MESASQAEAVLALLASPEPTVKLCKQTAMPSTTALPMVSARREPADATPDSAEPIVAKLATLVVWEMWDVMLTLDMECALMGVVCAKKMSGMELGARHRPMIPHWEQSPPRAVPWELLL